MKDKVIRLWDRIPPVFKNKFVLTALAFLTYMLFFDSMDIPCQVRLQRHLRQLDQQTEYLEKMIEKDKIEYAATLSTLEQMEKYAREEYMMKRDDEDLFIIEVK
jgi:cell division protein FtsB